MQSTPAAQRTHASLRHQLLWGLLLPIALFVVVDTISLYRQALHSVNTAYDRTLLASAKSIGEMLEVQGQGEQTLLIARVNYSALEAFEADNRSRMTYRVSHPDGSWIEGAQDLPAWTGNIPQQSSYAALVDFYDAQWRGDAVRVAVLLQPVASPNARAMATIQVAETLELRHELARRILWDTLLRQAILIMVITVIVLWVVHRVTTPIVRISRSVDARSHDDLSPIDARSLPTEMQPLAGATNRIMERLQSAIDHQKRFVRDAAHQLRTPLAVLKTQVQSARRGDIAAHDALPALEETIDRATTLANQMLSLAKVEQLRQDGSFEPVRWNEVLRDLALEMAPLVVEKDIDFGLDSAQDCVVLAHPWMLREISRNLLHNAIAHTPPQGKLDVSLHAHQGMATLKIQDSGSGISPELQQRLFQAFSTSDPRRGSGLGLVIAKEMVLTLHGNIALHNRHNAFGMIEGLTATVSLPLHTASS